MTLENYKRQIEQRLAEFLNEEQARAPSTEARLLLSRISELILRGGKRFRPCLMFKTYTAYGGKDTKSMIELGVAIELFHQALLFHDDIIDEDLVRHDGPNIVGFYNKDGNLKSTKIPQTMGLLAGDLLLALVYQIIINTNDLDALQRSKAFSLISHATIGVVYGQQLDVLDVSLKDDQFSETRMNLTHSLKTALYTTKLPMYLAAVLLDLPASEFASIDVFALLFGQYFQLADDYADYFNGHSKLRDYRQGKITYPYHIALQLAPAADAKFLKDHFSDKKLPTGLKNKVLNILKKCGADEASRQFAETYYKNALDGLSKLRLNQKGKDDLQRPLDDIRIVV